MGPARIPEQPGWPACRCAALISLLTCVETADFLSGTTDDHLFVSMPAPSRA